MAVPKGKTSKARRDSRRSSTWKLEMPGIVSCPQCHEPKVAHRICKKCGYYDGRKAIELASDKDKKGKKEKQA